MGGCIIRVCACRMWGNLTEGHAEFHKILTVLIIDTECNNVHA